jgi:hypothetical protein
MSFARAAGKELGGAEEEFVDAGLPAGQAITENGELRFEADLRRHRIVRRGIERVVDRHARARAERAVAVHDRVAAAGGEDEVVFGDERDEWIGGIAADALQGRGLVDVPEDDDLVAHAQVEDDVLER